MVKVVILCKKCQGHGKGSYEERNDGRGSDAGYDTVNWVCDKCLGRGRILVTADESPLPRDSGEGLNWNYFKHV